MFDYKVFPISMHFNNIHHLASVDASRSPSEVSPIIYGLAEFSSVLRSSAMLRHGSLCPVTLTTSYHAPVD